MLKNLRRKLRKSRSPSPANVQVVLSNDEIERELALATELRNTLSKFQPRKRVTTAHPIWTLLLPPELIYLIIDIYYSNDLETLKALAGTCKILSSYCQKHIYRIVIVGQCTATFSMKDPSHPERFARLVVQAPHILDHIQHLQITMQNCSRKVKFDPLNREEESIAFLLDRRMKNLRQFKLAIGIDWILLPDRLQHAISTIFQSPSLNDLIVEGIQSFPLNLLRDVKSLEVLDLRCDAAPPSSQYFQPSSSTVKPKVVYLHDPRPSTIRYIFGERSSISTAQLCCLSVFGNGKAMSTLENYFPSFSSSLTRLELDPGILGGVPSVPNLGGLPILRYLTLTVDIIVSLSLTLIGESLPRWQWVIDTLNTCYKPSLIQEIHVIVHINSPKQTQLCDWRALDSVFALSDDSELWPALEVVDVSICAEFSFDKGYLGSVFFSQFLPEEMVNLVRKEVSLRGRYSSRCFRGQLAQRRLHLS